MVSQKHVLTANSSGDFSVRTLDIFGLFFCQDQIIFLALAAAANKTDWTETFCRHKRNVVDRDGIRVAIDEHWLKYFWPIVRPLKEFVSQRWYEASLAVGQSYLCLYWPPLRYLLVPERTSLIIHCYTHKWILKFCYNWPKWKCICRGVVAQSVEHPFKGPSLVQLCWCGLETRRSIGVRKKS